MLAVDRLLDLGGIPRRLSPATARQLDAALPPTWSKANPVDIVGDADPARYAAALEALLADPENDAILVMNVPTAIARRRDSPRPSPGGEGISRRATPVAEARSRSLGRRGDVDRRPLSGAGIPNYPTERDAVAGFMHLVRHREVVEAAGAGSTRHAERVHARCRRRAADRCRSTRRPSLLARSDRGQAAVRCL